MPFDERELLARLIQCEAGGEGDVGMRAVASVIMNRVRTMVGEYGRVGGLYEIVFQAGQFDCVQNVNEFQNIYNMRPEAIHYAIADWALAGNRLLGLGEALWFYNPYTNECRVNFPGTSGVLVDRIGNHCFYAPTLAYAGT